MKTWLLVFLGLLTTMRLVLIGQCELAPDEAYYQLWSERLDYAYYSKGPMIALVIRAGTALFGVNEFGVRFFSPLLALGTSLLLFAFSRRLYGESVAVWTVLGVNAVPIFNAGGLLMTIDPLSIFLWTAALYAFWLALERSGKFSLYWPLTGLLIGVGFLSKYTNAMELLSIVLVLALTSKHRREFLRPGFWAMVSVFVLCAIPPVVWNARHEWITLIHLQARGGLNTALAFRPGELLEFIGTHFLVYSPLLFAGMMAAIVPALRRARMQFKPRFLLCFALPLLVMYSLVSLKSAGEANWTAPAFVSLAVLTAAWWHEGARHLRWVAAAAVCAVALGIIASLMVIESDLVRIAGVPWRYRSDPGTRLRGWKAAAERIAQIRAATEAQTGERMFLIANTYQTAAALGFYLPERRAEGPGHPPVYIIESQNIENQFSFWPRYDELAELRQIARDYLKSPGESSSEADRAAVAGALLGVPPDDPAADPEEVRQAWRTLVHALHTAMPDLPLDESFVEQRGVSLFVGRSAIFVTDTKGHKAPGEIRATFDDLELLGCYHIVRRGEELRTLCVFVCRKYRNRPL